MICRYFFRTALLLGFLIPVSSGYPQAGRSSGRPAGAPFLQHAKVYEESTYVTRIVFKNGMTVLVNEFRAQPVVSLQMHIRAGSFSDPAESPGMARLLAAMLLKGSQEKGTRTFRQEIQSLGGIARTRTDYHSTLFEIVLPSSQWKRALTLQATALANPPLTPEELKTESAIIESRSGNIQNSQFEELLELGFNQPRMASAHERPSWITSDSVKRFHKSLYTPSRMLLVVAGDVTSGEVLNEIVRLYGKNQGSGEAPEAPATGGVQDGLRYRAMRRDIAGAKVYMGFHAVPPGAPDFMALKVLSAILGLGNGSVLNVRLKDQKDLIYTAESRLLHDDRFGYLSIEMEMPAANIDRSEIALLTEIELLKRVEPGEAEMERAVAQLERLHWQQLQTVTGRAESLAFYETLGNWKGQERYVSDLRKVKPSDVMRVAATYLRLDKCSLLEYLPAGGEERSVTAEGIRSTFEGLLGPATEQEIAEREKETALAVKLPAKGGTFQYNEIRHPFRTASILRGPELYIREEHTSPLLEMGFFFPGGKLHENAGNSGITLLTLTLLMRDAAFQRQLELQGGHLVPVVAEDYSGFYFSILSRNIDSGFALLQEAVKNPLFDEKQIERARALQLWKIHNGRQSDLYPEELVNRALFGGFPYALDCLGSEAGLSKIDKSTLQAWYDSQIKNRKPLVVAIGDTKGTSLASYFVRHFSGSRMQDLALPESYASALEKGTSIEQKWDRRESVILFGFQAPPEDDEDGYPVAVLQGYAGSSGRLCQELRDRLGLVNEISMAYRPLVRGGSLTIRATTDSEKAAAAVNAMRAELQKMKDAKVGYRDFQAALNAAVGFHMIGNQSWAAQIHRLIRSVLAGKGIQGYNGYRAGIEEVTEDYLDSVKGKILNLDKAVVLVVQGGKQ